jgi:hypothetical protein
VWVVDPVVTQLVTQQLVPNSAEVAHEDLFAPTRTAVDKHGDKGSRRAHRSFSGIRIGLS